MLVDWRSRSLCATMLLGVLCGLFVLEGSGWSGDVLAGSGKTVVSPWTDAIEARSPRGEVDVFRLGGTTVTVEFLMRRTAAPEPWEVHYKYAISIVGATWVLHRAVRDWRLDAQRVWFEPRPRSSSDRSARVTPIRVRSEETPDTYLRDTGSQERLAARAGGETHVVPTPDTDPVEVVEWPTS